MGAGFHVQDRYAGRDELSVVRSVLEDFVRNAVAGSGQPSASRSTNRISATTRSAERPASARAPRPIARAPAASRDTRRNGPALRVRGPRRILTAPRGMRRRRAAALTDQIRESHSHRAGQTDIEQHDLRVELLELTDAPRAVTSRDALRDLPSRATPTSDIAESALSSTTRILRAFTALDRGDSSSSTGPPSTPTAAT